MNLITLVELTQLGRVFPLARRSKRPMRRWNWRIRNTDDVEVMNEWLEKYPRANWALVPIRAFVVDVDVKDGAPGPESIENAGGLTETFTVRTPSGGSHHYYAPDPTMSFATRDSWLPGVDIRYGENGYVVLPYSVVHEGQYQIEVDLDDLPVDAPHHTSYGSILTPIPDWIRLRWAQNPPDSSDTNSTTLYYPQCVVQECDKEWGEIGDRVRYMFFRNRKNGRIWNHKTLDTMTDRTQSGYEWQLAVRLMNVGATDVEIMIAYRVWCRKHNLKIHDRFNRTIRKARSVTGDYVRDWEAKQRVRRKQGSTADAILEAIQNGAIHPKTIIEVTGFKGSTVRMQLKRMTAFGKLVRTASGCVIGDGQEHLLVAA